MSSKVQSGVRAVGLQEETALILLKGENKMDSNKFILGHVVCTNGIGDRMNSDKEFFKFVKSSFTKYMEGDWGDTCEEDVISNNEAVKNGERILAVYIHKLSNTKIWIITELDRSVTTILFPEEY